MPEEEESNRPKLIIPESEENKSQNRLLVPPSDQEKESDVRRAKELTPKKKQIPHKQSLPPIQQRRL